MRTYDTTPTPDFLEVYRRVTGSDDISPVAVFGALLDDATALKINRAYDEIMRERKSQRSLLDDCPACGCQIRIPLHDDKFRCPLCGVDLVSELRVEIAHRD
jgi:predicted RNA-binding Zn-ribbon protein involved in translation (DUF1610 family)